MSWLLPRSLQLSPTRRDSLPERAAGGPPDLLGSYVVGPSAVTRSGIREDERSNDDDMGTGGRSGGHRDECDVRCAVGGSPRAGREEYPAEPGHDRRPGVL